MTGAKDPATNTLKIPRSGAFASATADTSEPEPTGSVLDEVVGPAVAAARAGVPAEPVAEPDEKPVPVRQTRRRTPAAATAKRAARAASSRPPMPSRIADADGGVPLQVKVPKQTHWDLKVATTLQGSNMTRVVTALLSVYNEDPELVEVLIDQADRGGQSLGELLHDVLTDQAAGAQQ